MAIDIPLPRYRAPPSATPWRAFVAAVGSVKNYRMDGAIPPCMHFTGDIVRTGGSAHTQGHLRSCNAG